MDCPTGGVPHRRPSGGGKCRARTREGEQLNIGEPVWIAGIGQHLLGLVSLAFAGTRRPPAAARPSNPALSISFALSAPSSMMSASPDLSIATCVLASGTRRNSSFLIAGLARQWFDI
jgi:hypothetical protein